MSKRRIRKNQSIIDRWQSVLDNKQLHKLWSESGQGLMVWIKKNKTLVDGVLQGLGFPDRFEVTDVDFGGDTLLDEEGPTKVFTSDSDLEPTLV